MKSISLHAFPILCCLLVFQLPILAQNIGIGTSSPASKLDVEGGVSIGTNYSGSVAAPANGAIIEGAVGIGTASPLGRLHVNNTAGFLAANLQSNSNVGTWLSIGNTDPGGRWFSIISTATNNGEGAGKLIFTRSAAANSTSGTIMAFEHATSNVGIGTFSPHASAIFDINSATKGVRLPQVALTSTNVAAPVAAPATSLLVYNTATAGAAPNNVVPGFYYWNGTQWVKLDVAAAGGGGADWHLAGNAGTNPATNFVGTTDIQPLAFRTSNVEKMRLLDGNANNGTLLVGVPSLPATTFGSIDAFATIMATGNGINNGDVVIATAGNSPFCGYFVSAKARGTLTTPTLVQNGDLLSAYESWGYDGTNYQVGSGIYTIVEGTAAAGDLPTAMTFATSADGTVASTERMRINNIGNVGIGTSIPSSKLHIIVPNDKNNNPSDNGLYVYNAGNAGDNDDAILAARVAGANAGDAFVSFDVSGVTGWSVGLDNSDADKFKIGNNWSDPGASTMMTIQTNGNVGIGTTTPATLFHVSGTTTNPMTVQSSSAESDIVYVVPSGNWQVGTNNAGNGTNNNQFYVYDNAYRLTVQNGTGNVGVGTTVPTAKLHVIGASGDENSNGLFRLVTPANGANLRMGVVDASRSWIQSHGSLPLYINTLGNNTILNLNGSNVGIGTATPAAGLHIAKPESGGTALGVLLSGGTSGNASMELRGGTSYIDFTNDASSDYDMRFIRDLDDRLQVQGGQLFVNGSYSGDDFGNTGTFIENFVGTGDLWFASGYNPYSIRANQWVIGNTFACYSDSRIKKEVHSLVGQNALNTLKGIQVSQYKYVDYVQNGPNERVGFIAQQVESVFPQAVTRMRNFIPNVYQLARNVAYDAAASTLTLTMGSPTDFQVGDKIQLFVDKEETPWEGVVAATEGNVFTLENWKKPVEKVFIYGKEVNDFKGVDYDRIFILGISAIQELDKKVSELEALKAEINQIRAEINELKARK